MVRHELAVDRTPDGGVNLGLFVVDGRAERLLFVFIVHPVERHRGRRTRPIALLDLGTRTELRARLDETTGDVTWSDPDAADARGATIDQFLEWYALDLPANDYAVSL